MRYVSPELVLVDPELSRIARELLPDRLDCLEARVSPSSISGASRSTLARRPPATFVPALAGTGAVHGASTMRHGTVVLPGKQLAFPGHHAFSGRARRTLTLVGRCGLGLAIIAVPFLAFLPAEESLRPELAAPRLAPARPIEKTAPSRPERSPVAKKREIAQAARVSAIRWPAVQGASLYNIVFVRGDDRIDRWVKENRLRFVPSSTRPLKADPLRTYRWFVYPWSPGSAGDRYGALIARGSVRLTKRSLGGRRS